MRREPKKNYRDGDNNVICDRTGFKIHASEGRYEWNGLFVWEKVWEERHPQDFVRGIPERPAADISRPVPDDDFLAVNEVGYIESIPPHGLGFFYDENDLKYEIYNDEFFDENDVSYALALNINSEGVSYEVFSYENEVL